MAKILIVEDDTTLAENLKQWLSNENHAVDVVNDGRDAMEHLRAYTCDAIVLDWALPTMSGLEILHAYRSTGGTSRVIMLTGKSKLQEKEPGLDSGADDYLTKSFHPEELSARLRALLRRPIQTSDAQLVCGDFTLDSVKRKVTRSGEELNLLPKEFGPLEFLMKHPGEVFTSEALLDRIWPASSDVSPESIRSYVSRLRAKIDKPGDPTHLENLHGVGHRFNPGS